MGAFVSLQGIKYRWKRAFGATEYDREREKEREEEENPDKSLSKAIVSSLEVNAVTDLPIYIGVRSTLLVYLVLAALFCYLSYESFTRTSKERFLSLTDDNICVEVPREVTGSYVADINGNWEGDEDFVYTNAVYLFQFNRLETSEDDFKNVIDITLKHLEAMSVMMQAENLAVTILVWTTWIFDSRVLAYDAVGVKRAYSKDNRTHFFNLLGSVATVFNQANLYTTSLNNVDGPCDIIPVARYDKAAAMFRITFPSSQDYIENRHCMNVLDIRNLGFNARIPAPDFEIVLDAETVLVSVAANLGLVPLKWLEKVPHSEGFFNATTENDTEELFTYGRYFHPRFPNMNTMYCLTDMNGDLFSCGLYLFSLNILPVFNHLGFIEAKSGELGYCECDADYSYENLIECNAFSFLTGFIFYNFNYTISMNDSDVRYNTEGKLKSDENYIKFISKYRGRLSSLNRDAFNISKQSAVRGFAPDLESRQLIYNFCSEGLYMSCSVLTVTSFSTGEVHSIGDAFYQLPWGHCNDTTSISEDAKRKLYNPPAQLTEEYYECKQTKLQSAVTALGISSATALSAKILFAFVLAVVLTGRKNGFKKSGKYKSYGVDEREEALQYFSFVLLSEKDKKPAERDGSNCYGRTISKLVKELSRQQHVRRFFVHSTETEDGPTDMRAVPDHEKIEGHSNNSVSKKFTEKIKQNRRLAIKDELIENPFHAS